HCFILTAAGCRFLESHGFEQRNTPADFGTTASVKPVAARRGGPLRTRPEDAPAGNEPPPSETPAWNGDLHELWFGERMIKRYVRPAPAQELILSVFQEEKWPPGIDDPLPSKSCQDPKRRLHYTIQNLNRGQWPQRLHFFING